MIIEDIADILELNGFGIFGENIFLNKMIDEPDNQVMIALLPGFPFKRKLEDVTYVIQVVVRDIDYNTAYLNGVAIANLFDDGDSRFHIAPSERKMVAEVFVAPSITQIDESDRAICILSLRVTTKRD